MSEIPARVSGPRALANMLPHGPVDVFSPSLIRTPRLVLRPLRTTDRAGFIRLVRDSSRHLAPFNPLREPGESDDGLFERQLALTERGDRTGRAWRRMVVLEDGRLAGACNLIEVRRGISFDGDANWWLGREFVRQGYMTEALGAMIDFAFLDLPRGLGLTRIYAMIQPSNSRSRRLADRIGFAMDGQRHSLHAGGRWDRHEEYSIHAPIVRRVQAPPAAG